MDLRALKARLRDLNLPGIRYFDTIGSTNDEAWRWARVGAPHAALVIADEQTAGRGRFKRHWVTTQGTGLAFSLILRSPPLDPLSTGRLSGLAALACCAAFREQYALQAEIKWPNDILVNRRKAGGVLAEAHWAGQQLLAAVVGIGINIAPGSIDASVLPPHGLSFPATCLEIELGYTVKRVELLHAILNQFFSRLPRLAETGLVNEWESWLAFRGQWVELVNENNDEASLKRSAPTPTLVGELVGLAPDGSLKLLTRSGEVVTVQTGEIHLRPAATQLFSSKPD